MGIVFSSADLPGATIVVFVRGGQVQWAAAGPNDEPLHLIVMDADTQELDDEDNPKIDIWEERLGHTNFDDEVAGVLSDFFVDYEPEEDDANN